MSSTINISIEETISKIKGEILSFVPVAIGKLCVLRKPEKRMFVFTKRTNAILLDTVLQVLLMNSYGLVVADLRNNAMFGKRNACNAPCELKYRLTWHPLNNAMYLEEKSVHLLILQSVSDSYRRRYFDQKKKHSFASGQPSYWKKLCQ